MRNVLCYKLSEYGHSPHLVQVFLTHCM